MKKLMLMMMVVSSASVWAGSFILLNSSPIGHQPLTYGIVYGYDTGPGGLKLEDEQRVVISKEPYNPKPGESQKGKGLPLTALIVSYGDEFRWQKSHEGVIEKIPLDPFYYIDLRPYREKMETVVVFHSGDPFRVDISSKGKRLARLTAGNGILTSQEWKKMKAELSALKSKDSGDKGDSKRGQAEASELPSAPGGMGWSGGVEQLKKQLDDCLERIKQLAEENKKLKEQYEFQAKTLKDRAEKLTSENNTLHARVKELEGIIKAMGMQ